MKLTIFFLIVVCLHVSAAGYGQNGTVTISGKDLSLEKVFSVIKKQTDYMCFYDYSVLKDARPVSLSFKDADVQEVLKAALWGQGLDFSITGKTITIMKRRVVVAVSVGPARTVKAVGIVYNEGGQPLSGANVTIKATGKGTITNAKGEFELPAVPEESPLVISFIGYAAQVVKVSDGKAIQVYLAVAKNELDKVVVQAYGSTTQRLSTSNIATVTGAEIERQPIMNPIQAIEGKAPGVVVTETNGYASSPVKIEIRGRSGINPNLPSEPLYIIDGVPLTVLPGTDANGNSLGGNYASGSFGVTQNGFPGPAGGQSPFFNLNPSDIDNISVLKDADATAIYGSRGANGVIVITTKKGKAGKTKFDFNVYTGASKVTQHYDLLNTQQYLAMRREAFKNDGLAPDAGSAYDLLVWDTTRYTDYQKLFWGGTGRTTDVETNLSGGDKLTTFRVSGSYHHETSILNYSGADQRGSVQFNLSHKSTNERLAISFTSLYSYTQSNLITVSSGVLLPPDAPPAFNDKGHINWSGWLPDQGDPGSFSNLFQLYIAKTGFLNSDLKLSYELVKGLSLSTTLGYSTSHNSQSQTFPIISQDPANNPTGSSKFGNNNNSNAIVEPQLEYSTFISQGKLNVLAGGTQQVTSQDGDTLYGSGYVNDNFLNSISNAPIKSALDNFTKYKYAAFFGRINYNWKDKYIVNLSARRDGSSRFGPGKQYGNFGAVGLAWIFTEEPWLKKSLPFLSFGKLRGSYGITGSDLLGDYAFLTRWSGSSLPYQGQPTYLPTQHANPGLQWEVNKKLEAALDLGFLHDRINMEVAWYRNRCGDQLVSEPLPIITGFNSVQANLPALVQNSGWEAVFRAKIVDKKDFDWSVNANAGFNHNKLVSFPNLALSPYYGSFEIGQPLNLVHLLHYIGVDPQTGKYTFQDRNKDGQIDRNDFGPLDDRYSKDLSVRVEGGFGTDMRYKNWQLYLFFHARKVMQASAIYNGSPGQIGNQATQVLNHWQKPGDKALYARYTTQPDRSDNNFLYFSDGVYSDGSYIRLQNLSLSYDFPGSWIHKLNIQTFRIYVRGQNLFILTKYNGIDPSATTLGQLPPPKILTGGIQLNF